MHIGIEMCSKSSFLYDVSDNMKIEDFTFSCTYSQTFCVLNLHFILNSKVWKFLVLQVQTLMWLFYEGWNGFMQGSSMHRNTVLIKIFRTVQIIKMELELKQGCTLKVLL